MSKSWRAVLVYSALILTTLAYFWLESRYPALDTKAYYSNRNAIAGIAFDPIFQISPDAGRLERIVYNSLNWYHTNWKGMAFGLILSILILAALQQFGLRSPRNPFLASLFGIGIGAPMGVCVNCATPIGDTIKRAGARAETAVAMTMSSPTLNFVVLSFLFTTFPFYVAALKTAAALLLLLLVVPLLARGTPAGECPLPPPAVDSNWPKTLKVLVRDIFLAARTVIVATLPLMLLAGLLGATVVEFLDLSALTGGEMSLGKLALVSAVGTLLPVPMTFDILFGNMLLQSGVSTSYVTALLLTLGIFSLYPFMLFFRNISRTMAVGLLIAVWLCGIAGGVGVDWFERHQLNQADLALRGPLADSHAYQADASGFTAKMLNDACDGQSDADRCRLRIISAMGTLAEARDLCGVLKDPTVRKECLATRGEDALGKSLEKCADEKDQDACLSQAMITFSARDFADLSPRCQKSPKLKAWCSDIEDLRRASRFRATKNCKSIQSTSFREKCLELTLMARGKLNGGKEAVRGCEKLEGHVRERCLYRIISRFGTLDQCTSIKEKKLRARCKAGVAARSGDCRTLEIVPLRATCEKRIVELKAIERLHAARRISSVPAEMPEAETTQDTVVVSGGDFAAPQPIQPLSWSKARKLGELWLSRTPHHPRGEIKGRFTTLWGPDIGLDLGAPPALEARWHLRGFGLAAGDINGDGYVDVAAGGAGRLNVFFNDRGKNFRRQPLDMNRLQQLLKSEVITAAVALIDMNNDGELDLFVTNFDGSNFYLPGKGGLISVDGMVQLPKSEREITLAPAFGDFNHDGKLDVFLGNSFLWPPGYTTYTGPGGTNELLIAQNGKFVSRPWQDRSGPTMSVMASDFDQNGHLDLFVANDFQEADVVHLGTGGGEFVTAGRSMIEVTPADSMGWDSGDIDNDQIPELYGVGYERRPESFGPYCETIKHTSSRKQCEEAMAVYNLADHVNVKGCANVPEARRGECWALGTGALAWKLNLAKICERLPKTANVHRRLCYNHFAAKTERGLVPNMALPQVRHGNVLLKRTPDGKLENIAPQMKVTNTHWGWTARFADLNNDTFQDIYAANGKSQLLGVSPKILFLNQEGRAFREAGREFGLDDQVDTYSMVFADFDRDGDVDVLANGLLAPLRLFKNEATAAGSVTLELEDSKANSHCIGCKILVSSQSPKGPVKQLREIKASGAYASFDPPEAHFGLGDLSKIDSMEIHWSDGARTRLPASLAAGFHYKIKR
jgi:uncharacterized membrane protein YraQ (UPF0718 family)